MVARGAERGGAALALAACRARLASTRRGSAQASAGVVLRRHAGAPRSVLRRRGPQRRARWWSAGSAERVAVELEDARTVLETEVDPTHAPWNALQEGGREHRMLVLTAGDGTLIAIAVLSGPDIAPDALSAAQLRALADDLCDALTDARSAHTSVPRMQLRGLRPVLARRPGQRAGADTAGAHRPSRCLERAARRRVVRDDRLVATRGGAVDSRGIHR